MGKFTPRSRGESSCYVVDIVFCVIIICIAILTLGIGLILFFIYIPISLIVHYAIREHQKPRKKAPHFRMRDMSFL